jgi:tellurite resistance protein TerC
MVTPLAWGLTLAAVAGLLALDAVVGLRRSGPVGLGAAVGWSAFYIAAALAFGIVLGALAGWDLGAQYFTGYVVEKSLSIDNLFVFVIIMASFAVPPSQQPMALTLGIVMALVLRGIFIAAGAALLDAFSFMFAVFGLGLVFTAVQLFRHRDVDPSVEDNPIVAGARRRLPLTAGFHGGSLFVRRGGRRLATPMLLVLLAIGTTDMLFALDSIPAVFGVTRHPYIVFCANAFALLGLRALFFLVSGLLDRLVYLSLGLSLILAFIGVKLILEFAHLHIAGVPEISTTVSLVVIGVVLIATAVASLVKSRRDPEVRAHAGSVRGHQTPRGSRSPQTDDDFADALATVMTPSERSKR